jgi:pimeloyl-ACP methyl ester carboxylesterase
MTTADLEAGLAAAGIGGPYVVVGHSLGAYESLLFTDRNKAKVAGMVLVDPSIVDQVDRIAKVAGPPAPPPAGQEMPSPPPLTAIWRACAAEIRAGTLTAQGPDPHQCLAFLGPPYPPAVQAAVTAKLASSPLQFESIANFVEESLPTGAKLVIDPVRDYGDMPLIVLTALDFPPGAPVDQRAYVEAVMAEGNRAHDEYAALSTRGINARVPGTGHNIQDEKPQVVIDAVLAVVRAARADKAK